MISNRYLYRGVSEKHFEESSGKLKPKSNAPFASYACCGQAHAIVGYGIIAGNSARNEVSRHQIDKGGETSGISTTPVFERAVFYATQGGKVECGYVYTIDREQLEYLGVNEFIVEEHTICPWQPEDEEVILVARDHGCIPDAAIASIEKVRVGQRRKGERKT